MFRADNNDAPDPKSGSPERFGYSWDRFSELTPEQETQFRQWTCHLDPETGWRGKTFLDAGCGAGRNSYWPMTYGAAGGLAIDVDERSLAVARRNLAAFRSMEVRFLSIFDLDVEDGFDIAFSIGVIHHLDDPELAVRKMARAVKPGGKVLIWVYGYENLELYVNVLAPLRKLLLGWLPIGLVRVLAYFPAVLLWAVVRTGLFKIEYLRMLRRFPFHHLHHIVFDQMLPRTAHYWRRAEVEALMHQAGLEGIDLTWVNQLSWSAIGTKPGR